MEAGNCPCIKLVKVLLKKLQNDLFKVIIRALDNCLPVMGKKNYLFFQDDLQCYYGAMMYSFFACCDSAGIDPLHWLEYVLDHINTTPKDKLITLIPSKVRLHEKRKSYTMKVTTA